MTGVKQASRVAGVLVTIAIIWGLTAGFMSSKSIEELFRGLVPGADTYSEISSIERYRTESQPLDGVRRAFVAYAGEQPKGLIVQVDSYGYNKDKPISALVGFDAKGTVTSVRVTSHSETPGWAVNLDEGILQKRFLFLPKDARLVLAQQMRATRVGEVEAVTGATVTSKGLARGVEQARRFFRLIYR